MKLTSQLYIRRYVTIAKSSNDILAGLTTSRELMKSDIAKYDALLTEHITKSGINTGQTHIKLA